MKKIFFIFSVSLFYLSAAFAQKIEWQNTIGGNALDILNMVSPTPDKGFILGGGSASDLSGDKTDTSLGNIDCWIIKVDSLGNIQWQKSMGGTDLDNIYSVFPTADLGYICGGYSSSDSSYYKTENAIGGYDYWVIKLDASGNIQWENTIGGVNDEYMEIVVSTPDHGYIIGGCSDSWASGDKTEGTMGSFDYWIVKLDSLGNIQWQNTIGGSQEDCLNSLELSPDGGFIIGGYSSSGISGDKTESSRGQSDYWIVKIDSTGNIQWQKTIGGNDDDMPYSVIPTLDGGYLCGGTSTSTLSGDKTENSNGAADAWFVKLDPSGNLEWQNTIGGIASEELHEIALTADSGFICGGNSSSNISGDIIETPVGSSDYWVMKLGKNGGIEWQNLIGGSSIDNMFSINLVPGGGYICGGYSNSNLSGDKSENSQGSFDFWIMKVKDEVNSITGKLFLDQNSNAVRDAGEPFTNHQLVKELNTGNIAFSGTDGFYKLAVWDPGNYSVTSPALNYYTSVPANHNVSFSGIQEIDSLNDFALQPVGSVNDLCISITPMGPFRAGMNANYTMSYTNYGNTILSPTVIFFPDSDIVFLSATVTASSVTSDSVVWNLPALNPFETGNILVTVKVNTGTPIGTLISPFVRIEPIAGDANPGCNVDSWEIFSTGSYDPNLILVSDEVLTTDQLISPPYLDYIIYFQNTGNDTAFNVRVLNPVDTNKVNLPTFEFISSSHPVTISYRPWEHNFEFSFSNILLPDSNVNEPGSHGFIRYRIKPRSTLVQGDSIMSTAYIYFDFNAPVQTNTAVTHIVLPSASNDLGNPFHGFLIYPNPSTDKFEITYQLFNTCEVIIDVTDVMGKTICRLKGETQLPGIYKTYFDLQEQNVAKGFYLVNIKNSEFIMTKKIIVH